MLLARYFGQSSLENHLYKLSLTRQHAKPYKSTTGLKCFDWLDWRSSWSEHDHWRIGAVLAIIRWLDRVAAFRLLLFIQWMLLASFLGNDEDGHLGNDRGSEWRLAHEKFHANAVRDEEAEHFRRVSLAEQCARRQRHRAGAWWMAYGHALLLWPSGHAWYDYYCLSYPPTNIPRLECHVSITEKDVVPGLACHQVRAETHWLAGGMPRTLCDYPQWMITCSTASR